MVKAMLDYDICSLIGTQEQNEDTVKVFQNPQYGGQLFLVADGLGGHGGGKFASEFVAARVGFAFSNAEFGAETFLDDCFSNAQTSLLEQAELTGHLGMRTTLVLLLLQGNKASWGHIGDSRLYVFRSGKVLKQTLDHSVPQMLVDTKKIKPSEIRRHPDRSKLLSAMGGDWNGPEYEIDERSFAIKEGDAFLLCTDGFWDWIDEKAMLKFVKNSPNARTCLEAMQAEVLKNAKGKDMDNYSAILVFIK